MGLSVREQQALDFMAEGLADSAPKLASLLATFARLISGEQMPVHEKILLARRRETHGAHRLYRCPGLHPAALLWLLITVVLVAVALVIGGSGSQGRCATSWAVICTGPAPAHSLRPAAHKTAADLALRATSMRHATSAALRSTGGSAAALMVLPDILRYDRTQPAHYRNGRVPTDDVHSMRFAWLSHGKVPPTGLKPHDDLLNEFPYLGLPNP